MSYPTTPLKTFADVQNLLDAFIKSANATGTAPIDSAPHQRFWRINPNTKQPMTWEYFTTGVLPLNAQWASTMQWPAGDPNSPLILVVGKPDQSPIINMLSASGDYFNNGPGNIPGQMPQDSPPYDPDPPYDPPQALVIQLLTDWIKNGCPNGKYSLVRREDDT